MSANRIVIEREGHWWVVSDDESEFARATTITEALRYASDLMYGPGTGPRGSLWNLMEAIENARRVRKVESNPDGPFDP